jgi:hypothetical protein
MPMEEIARVYADALFGAAKERGKLDEIHEQLGEFADALEDNRDMQRFFFSPYFSSAEKRDALSKAVDGAEPELVNFLELLAEKHRMPVLFRIRRQFDDLWAKENKRLGVTVTRADRRGDREADRQPGRALQPGRRGDSRRPGTSGGQHGLGRERSPQARETAKERRERGVIKGVAD